MLGYIYINNEKRDNYNMSMNASEVTIRIGNKLCQYLARGNVLLNIKRETLKVHLGLTNGTKEKHIENDRGSLHITLYTLFFTYM